METVAKALPPLLPTPPRSEMLPLLPTPPKSKMLPLLPTPHGVVLTMLVSAMSGRADFVQRWDWNKTGKKPCSSIRSSSSWSSSGSESTGRADSVDRWDSDKKYRKPPTTVSSSSSSSSSSYSAGSPGRADSVERWDSKKLASSCSASQPTCRGRHDGNTKRLPSPGPGRASSAERWDLHKKPRPEHMPQTNATATAPQKAVFAGPCFYASPDPSMLPMPSFFLRAH
ncbi:hypothetical protein CFC21_081820 [Triticum aestivum]|uniref:DUF4005 domain-containing protein n=2 Tax=Triticum aestivum TaxID=4565 RepID=A0A9R1L4C6_WHEAT|nr:hypothetical protein CFC21_081820 [Triticum aestivum]